MEKAQMTNRSWRVKHPEGNEFSAQITFNQRSGVKEECPLRRRSLFDILRPFIQHTVYYGECIDPDDTYCERCPVFLRKYRSPKEYLTNVRGYEIIEEPRPLVTPDEGDQNIEDRI